MQSEDNVRLRSGGFLRRCGVSTLQVWSDLLGLGLLHCTGWLPEQDCSTFEVWFGSHDCGVSSHIYGLYVVVPDLVVTCDLTLDDWSVKRTSDAPQLVLSGAISALWTSFCRSA